MGNPDRSLRLPSPLTRLYDDRLGSVRVLLKRDDLIHPVVTGNKWRKLKYLVPVVREAGASTLLTFGGAYSNHVRALAALGRCAGFRTIGVIRGDERPSNDLLAASVADGMHLHYVDRVTYRHRATAAVEARLRAELGDFYLVPEGGTTRYALPGCAELVDEIAEPFDLIVTAVGTGGTLAGIATGLRPGQRAIGVSVLTGAYSLDEEVAGIHHTAGIGPLGNWTVDHRFPHRGFGRRTPELDRFIADFEARHALRLDHVYVGKMMFALFAMVARDEFPPSSTIVAVVTGPGPPVEDRSRRHSPALIV